MKFQIVSDLHLEYEDDFRVKNQGADALILSGDICMAMAFTKSEASPYFQHAQKVYSFFEACAKEFDAVYYIMGNHESYRFKIENSAPTMKHYLKKLTNVHVLDNDFVDVGDIRICGTTLWTDMNREDPITLGAIRDKMNDFRLIETFDGEFYRKFSPYDAVNRFKDNVKFLDEATSGHDKCVVLTHHAPTYQSVEQKYRRDPIINGAYYSELTEFMMDRPQIKLWTHGHMHNTFEYQVEQTKVVCNPRGYNDENPNFTPNKVWEV